MSIQVNHITKLYGEQKALDDISFSVGSGEVVGLLGPNGAGKSTLMKIITCFLPQTSGSASVCGRDVTQFPMEVKRRVGYLPEHNPLYPDLYVREYLAFVARLYKVPDAGKRIAAMIERTGLGAEQHKKIGALSKGYRQRVGLAQALIHDPEVLVLDEPTSGLDPNQLVEIRELIRNSGKEKTVILSTHIMQEVEAICGRVIIINKGRLVADGQTDALQQGAVRNTLLVELDQPMTRSQWMGIAGVADANPAGGNTWRVQAQGDTDVRQAVFRYAVEKGMAVLSMQKEEQRLEDVFHSLTRPAGS
jgi:ABC-2 type transport system ATP-binding protein